MFKWLKQKIFANPRIIYKNQRNDIIVEQKKNIRTLYFVWSNKKRIAQCSVNIQKPYQLMLKYSHYLLSNLILSPKPKNILILGLGGAALVHYLYKHFPNSSIEVVEINSEVIKIAKKYFFLNEKQCTLYNQDASDFTINCNMKYDCIYFDINTIPNKNTDSKGLDLKLKSKGFLEELYSLLTSNGTIAFNFLVYDNIDNDLQILSTIFPSLYHFDVPGRNNKIVIATKSTENLTINELNKLARDVMKNRNLEIDFQNNLKFLK